MTEEQQKHLQEVSDTLAKYMQALSVYQHAQDYKLMPTVKESGMFPDEEAYYYAIDFLPGTVRQSLALLGIREPETARWNGLTKAQGVSIKLKYRQNPDGSPSLQHFVDRVHVGDTASLQWCGMVLGIEQDGYCHS